MHAPRAPESVRRQPPASPGRRAAASRPAFTLIELVVVLTIVTILASLTLGGLAVTRQRARIDKTKSTIRKIHELIVPHYESYLRRRVPMGGASGPQAKLVRTRQLVMFEMPDAWVDVAVSGTTANGQLLGTSEIIPTHAWNGVTRGYAAYRQTLNANHAVDYPSSECLYMIVSRGLGEPDVMEQFRSDEIGDIDGDGAPEFIDGWGQPIAFIRWPVGFNSPIQSQNASLQSDPFDPFGLSGPIAYPNPSTLQRDYAVTPLIVSGGPDGASSQYGVSFGTVPWHSRLLGSSPSLTLRLVPPSPDPDDDPNPGAVKAPDLAADNVTNHDLLAK